jgi:hypothetical protein
VFTVRWGFGEEVLPMMGEFTYDWALLLLLAPVAAAV